MRQETDDRGLDFGEIVELLNPAQRTALLTDERAIEQLPFQDRDGIIVLGLARRAWPNYTADKQWRTWLTPLGLAIRVRLAPGHYNTEVLLPGLAT